jgi:hypothetical protein
MRPDIVRCGGHHVADTTSQAIAAAAAAAAAAATVLLLTAPVSCCRYRAPKRTYELMAAFGATHRSIHNVQAQTRHLPQPQQQQASSKMLDAAASRHTGREFVIHLNTHDNIGRLCAKVKDTTRFGTILANSLKLRKVPADRQDKYRLLFYGERPSLHTRLKDEDVKDGDVFDIFLQQVGD